MLCPLEVLQLTIDHRHAWAHDVAFDVLRGSLHHLLHNVRGNGHQEPRRPGQVQVAVHNGLHLALKDELREKGREVSEEDGVVTWNEK